MKRVSGRHAMNVHSRENAAFFGVFVIPLAFAFVFFVLPIGHVMVASLGIGTSVGRAYAEITSSEVYVTVFQNTLFIVGWVVLATLIIGYCLAVLMVKVKPRRFYLLLILLLSPILMNQLSRNFAWMMILDTRGVLNSILIPLGVVSAEKPLELIYNRFGVIVVLVHGLVPIMALSIYTAISNIESDLLLAAKNLGANSLDTLLHIYFPLSLPGVFAGCFFVAILSFGYYITPAMLGGSKGIMVAKVVDQLLNRQGDEELASALSTVLVLVCLPTAFFLMRSFNNLRRSTSL